MNKGKLQNGQIIILALVFMALVTTFVVSLVGYAQLQIRSHRQAVAKEAALNIAEAGIETAIWKLNNQPAYTGETNTSFAQGVYNITVTNLSGSAKLIRADAFIPNPASFMAKRSIQVTATIGTINVGFNYGVQVGEGGLVMDNNAQVIGNIYSNGNIQGSSGATITGTVIVAGSSGTISSLTINTGANAHNVQNSTISGAVNAYSISGSTISGNVSAAVLSDCTISGNVAFNTKSHCTISGSQTTPNPNVPTDPVTQALPIDQAQIDIWTQEAVAGGVVGSQTINGSVSLGPKEINGNLTVNGTLTVTGTLWVTGNITLSNNSIMQLSPSYGSLSGVVIAGTTGSTTNGIIDLSNNVQILGSGTAGSYLLMLSQHNGTSDEAIDISNNVTGAIFYAGSGLIEVSNNAGAKELTAYKIHLNNNAVVTYESGLANASFSAGPAGGWQMASQSWQLLQ